MEAPRLDPEDERHALRVLRLAPGDLLIGLDGRGRRAPLRVASATRSELALEPAGPVETAPRAGEEGADLPWIEVAVAWPRRARADDMLGRLVQLGAAAIRPLHARQRGPEEPPERASARMVRVGRETCKQCGRAWLPEFERGCSPEELVVARPGAGVALLDPAADLSLDTWLRSLRPGPHGVGTRSRPIVLAVGPEGGFTAEERSAPLEHGASPVWVGPHVLRVETAAEAAMAVAAAVLGRPRAHLCG